ncbi:hypothetical protein CYY_006416 [Polysphondylium violaceum]|uniref:non-specific serine/threonine protein kinase n=1 Tax=Polysphondylium violaceum TaxID=133409 RepID=A0A8J4PRX0_9MYCE|nr:hypothetical protein CYY_006416 [Polysphondylium violaceum]
MKLFKKAKQHFFQTQSGAESPQDPEQVEKVLKDINPNNSTGPQGYIVYCETPDGGAPKESSETTPSTTPSNDGEKKSSSADKPYVDEAHHIEEKRAHKDQSSEATHNTTDEQPQPQPPTPQQQPPAVVTTKERSKSISAPSNTSNLNNNDISISTTTPSPPTNSSDHPSSTTTTNSESQQSPQQQPEKNGATPTTPPPPKQSTAIQQSSSSSTTSLLASTLSKFKIKAFKSKDKDKEHASDKKIVNKNASVSVNNNNPPQKTTPDQSKAEEKQPEKEIILIKSLEDFPDDCQKLIRISQIPEEKLRNNLAILAHVLHFRTGKQFKLEHDLPKEPRKKFHSEKFNDGETLLEHYEPAQLKKLYKDCDQVGKGGFGTVYFAKSTKEKRMVAIKKMPHITKRQIQQNYREASILSKCDHPNIVKLYTCHIDKDSNLWIVMEFMEGGTFEEAAKAWKFNENNLAYVARELLKGLQYLHENGMVHRDLKSANIMMSVEGKVKLIDFGLCEDISTSTPCHMVGSPFWMPPEMIQQKPHSTPVDIWSFAISLLEMANQRPPMMESAVKAMFTVATEGATSFDEPELWSDCFKEFLSLCLKMDPAERATAADLLKHPFIKKADSRDNMENILKKIFLTNSLMNSGF